MNSLPVETSEVHEQTVTATSRHAEELRKLLVEVNDLVEDIIAESEKKSSNN